ncbi:expressed unknown protein [Seminavis robusta]|uniref:Uncharacterized protein n=1 Tax=Seminavis robusta TaxID=568900 RepID=A0A9N8E442_9STRA|nr:expressed unknown protein [Seminavis robusta]|eukprot:Sro643_g180250.1 n/a (485) ;mRNA; f:14099-15553
MFSPKEFLRHPTEYVQNYREYCTALNEMRDYDEVLLDANSYFKKVAHVLKRERTKEMTVVINPYESASQDSFNSLRKACMANRSATHLTICVGSQELASFEFNFYEIPEVAWEKTQIRALSSALLGLPCLTHLKIDFSKLTADEEDGKPFLELFSALTRAKNLKHLMVKGYMLRHSDEMFGLTTSKEGPLAKLCQPLQNHPSLEHVTLCLQSDELPREASVAPIVKSFQSLPKLKSLEITDKARMAFGRAHLTCGGLDLQDILQTKTGLESLKMWLGHHAEKDHWVNEDLKQVARGLEANSSLRTLLLGVDPDSRKAMAAKQLDQTDHTARTEAMTSSEFFRQDSDSDYEESDDDESLPKYFGHREIFRSDPKKELLHVFQQGQNCTLCELSVFDMALHPKMAVFLELNGTGRKHLVDMNAAPEQWMSHIVLKQPQLSLDATFELLRMNPVAALPVTTSKEVKKSKKSRTKKSWRKKMTKVMRR